MSQIPGFQIPIHQSLVKPMLMAGVPRTLAILNGTFGAALTFGLHAWYGIVMSLIIHLAAYILTKKDPYFFDVLLRHLRQKKFYFQ